MSESAYHGLGNIVVTQAFRNHDQFQAGARRSVSRHGNVRRLVGGAYLSKNVLVSQGRRALQNLLQQFSTARSEGDSDGLFSG